MEEKDASVCLWLDDEETASEGYKEAWQQFWSACNLLQYLPQFIPVSESGIECLAYAEVIENQPDVEELVAEALSLEWQEAIQFTTYPKQLLELDRAGCAVPEIGREVISGFEAIGDLEWGWVDEKVGLGINLSELQVSLFVKEGWKVVTGVEESSLQQLIEWLA